MQMTLEERQVKLEALVSYEPALLVLATVKELRGLAKGLIVGSHSYKKQELLDKLLELSSEMRETKRLQELAKAEKELLDTREQELKLLAQELPEVPTATLKELQSSKFVDAPTAELYGIELYKKLKDLVARELMADNRGFHLGVKIGALASEVVAKETKLYPNFLTRKTRRTVYLRLMAEAARGDNTPFKDEVWQGLEAFRATLLKAWRVESDEVNLQYRETVLQAKGNLEALDPRQMLAEAREILEAPDKYKWTALVKALIIATGRRPSEIMVTASFKICSDHEVEFTGLLKERRDLRTGVLGSKVEKPITIPTLLPSKLVVDGMVALTKTGKRLEPSDDYIKTCKVADRKYSSSFSQMMFGTGFTLKDLRKLYAVTSKVLFKPNNVADNIWFQRVLGHDLITSGDSYDRYYIEPEVVNEVKQLVA